MTVPAELSYVYAIGRRDRLAGVPLALAGVADGPVRTVEDGELAAFVSSVPAAEFDDEGFRAQLEDLARLEAVARAHHAVVDHLADRTTVLPLRLATVYHDDANVALMLQESRERFTTLLGGLEGRAEWGVKVYACPSAVPEQPAAPEPAPAGTDSALSPGRAYLQQRRARRTRDQDAHRSAADAVDRIGALAVAYTADVVPHRPQSGELATGEGENVSNVSYLLLRDRGEAFCAEVAETVRAVPGVRVEVTGPWAPYSFAEAPSAPAMEGSSGR
jgi:hypothetical protein